MTVVHETGNLKKIMCPPMSSVSSGAPNGICKILQTGGKQAVGADLRSAVHLLSMRAGCQSLANSDQTVKLGSADQIWINIMLR